MTTTTTATTKLPLIHPQIGFAKLSYADLLTEINVIKTGVLTTFKDATDLPIDAATITSTIDNYSSAITDAADGSKTAKSALATQRKDILAMARVLGHHVEVASKGDMTTFLSSGFKPIVKVKSTIQAPAQASIVRVDQANTTQLALVLLHVAGALIYQIRYAMLTAGLPGAWTIVLAANSKTATVIGDLTPGSTYSFQVRAYNKAGYSDWSDAVTKMCT